jgi:starvation-inducible outer membrane lipoprotein
MKATISDVLEGVDSRLARAKYRIHATEAKLGGFVVHVENRERGTRQEFPVSRDELATDARAEWVARGIAMKVKNAALLMMCT